MRRVPTTALLALWLAGCSSGGGDDAPPGPPPTSQPFTASAGTIAAQREAGAARRKIRETAVEKAAETLKNRRK